MTTIKNQDNLAGKKAKGIQKNPGLAGILVKIFFW